MWRDIRRFRAGRTPSQNLPAEFEDGLLLIIDPEQLTSNLCSKLRQFIDVQEAAVYLVSTGIDRISRGFRLVAAAGEDPCGGLSNIPMESRIAEWFRVNQEILVFRENDGVTRYLADDLHPFLDRGMGLAFPLISMDRLLGLVFLRLGQTSLDKCQLATLRMLGRQAGLAFENALLFKERLCQNERMCRAEQLAVMGQFAAGVAHELRNPLTTIRSTMQFLAEEFAAGSEHKKLAETMLEEVDRLNGIVGNLLSFGRPAESKPVAVDLRGELDKCAAFIEARARHQQVQLEIACAGPLPKPFIDPAELRQVLVNVMINGLQAMSDGGTLRLRVQYPCEASRAASSSRDRILVEVSDEGPGVPENLREKVFEPFFTTKPGGTGLGLPICRSIVRRYGGDIWIEAGEAGGASVKILLPGE